MNNHYWIHECNLNYVCISEGSATSLLRCSVPTKTFTADCLEGQCRLIIIILLASLHIDIRQPSIDLFYVYTGAQPDELHTRNQGVRASIHKET